MLSRRNALTILGLSAGTGLAVEDAFSQEDLAIRGKPINGFLVGNDAKTEKIAEALRKLASEMDARGIDVISLQVGAEIKRDHIVTQTLNLEFVINDEKTA